MGIHTQQQEGYGRTIISVYSLCGYIMTNFLLQWSDLMFPADHADYPPHPTMHVPDRTVPLPPTKIIYVPPTKTIYVLPTPSTPSIDFQIAASVFALFILIGSIMVVHAILIARSCLTWSSPSYSSAPACWEECGELLDIADDDMDDDPSEEDHGERGGDGDDYPGDGASDEADILDEEIQDALPSEDPPLPPDPPSQTAAADPDSTPGSIPLWLLMFLLLFSATTLSLVLKHLVHRLCRVLGRIKVYTGSSILRLFVYIEDPSCALEWAVHHLCHVLDWVKVHTRSSILDLTVYIADSGYHAVARTAVSSSADVEQLMAPFQPQNSNVVQQVTKWNITKLFGAYILPGVLEIAAAFGVSGTGVLVHLWWHLWDGVSGLITQEEDAQYVMNHQDDIVVQTDDVEIPFVASTKLQEHAATQTDEDDFMAVIDFLFNLRLIFLDHQGGALPTLTTAVVENITKNVTAPCSSSASKPMVSEEFTGFVDEVLPATHEQDVGHTSEEDDSVTFHSLPDASVSLIVPVDFGMEMVSIEGGSGSSYIEEVVDEQVEEKDKDSERSDLKTSLTTWHGERVITDTPFLVATSVQVSNMGGPAILPPISLPKRVLELRLDSFGSPFPLRRLNFHSTPRQTMTPPDTTSPSYYVNRPTSLFDSLRLEFFLVSESCGSRSPSVEEVEQPTRVEADAGLVGKADLPQSKMQITVEAEGVATDCEPHLVGLAELVGEKSVGEDLEVALESAVATADEEPFVESPISAVKEKLVEVLHTSTFTSADEAPIGSQEQDGEDSPPIDFVDGAGVHRYFMPHLSIYRSVVPLTLDGPAVPTSPPQLVYCPCCPGMKLEWDELSMVDDIVAELRCHSLPHGMDEYHIELAAQDDLYDVVAEGIDLQMWGRDFVVIDGDDEVEEVEVEMDSDYEEEDALWIHHSDEADEDEEEEVKVLTDLLSGLFEPIHSQNDNHEEADEELAPQSLAISCHDENAGHQHHSDVSFDLSAVLYVPPDVHDVFGFAIENIFGACPSGPREDVKPGQPSCMLLKDPPSPAAADEKVPVAGSSNDSGPIVVDVDSAHIDVPSGVAEAEKKRKTWPFHRVMRESKALQNQEDQHRWQLRSASPAPSPGPPEENEFQRMRATLRRPANMTDQEKRLRQVWELHGTEKGRALKEQRLRRTQVVLDSG